MKLITKKIEAKLLKHPFYSTDSVNEKDVLVKFFNPCGIGTWYVFEGEKHGDDWEFFGLVDLYEKELGYFRKRFCHPLKRIPAVRRVFISERRFPCGKIVKFYEKGYATY